MAKNKKWIQRGAYLFFSAALALFCRGGIVEREAALPAMHEIAEATPSMAYKESLGNWTNYNGIIFGDAAIYDTVSGGGLAVAGNLSIYENFTVGSTYSAFYDATKHIGEYKNESGYPALLYGGERIVTGAQVESLPVHGGSITMTQEMLSQNAELVNGFIPGTDAYFQAEAREILEEWFAAQYDLVKNSSGLFVQANDAEISLAEFGDGTYLSRGANYFRNQYLTYEDEIYENALFITVRSDANLDFGQWWPVQALITFDMDWVLAHDLVVFNFPDAVNVTMNASTFQIQNLSHWSTTVDAWIGESGMQERLALAEKVVYNFPRAGSIEANRALIQGTVLAPNAVFTGIASGDAGHIYGHIVAREFLAQGNFTIHAFSLSKWAFDIVEDAIEGMGNTGDIILRQYLYFDREPTPIRVEGGVYVLADAQGNFYDGAGGFTTREHAKEYEVEGLDDLIIGSIPLGQYMLIHSKAPPGFIVNTDNTENGYTYAEYPLILTRMDERVHILRYIEPAFTELTFQKRDGQTGAGLAGAAFAAIRLGDRYEETTIGGRFTSGEDGLFTMKGLPIGEYRLVELKTPEGYSLPAGGDFYFTVFWDEAAGRLAAMDAEGTVFSGMPDAPVIIDNTQSEGEKTLLIIKYAAEQEDDDTVATLPGAVFALYRYDAESARWQQVMQEGTQEEPPGETPEAPAEEAPADEPEAEAENESEAEAEEEGETLEEQPEAPADDAHEETQEALLQESNEREPENAASILPEETGGEETGGEETGGEETGGEETGGEETGGEDTGGEDTGGEDTGEAPENTGQPLEIITNELGYSRVHDLAAGEYRLVEIKAPAGFGINNPHRDPEEANAFPQAYAHAFTMREEDTLHTAYLEGAAVTAALFVDTKGSLLEETIPLRGAVYKLEKRLQDGATWEELAYAAQVDERGRVTFAELEAGVYRLTQTNTSEGYWMLMPDEILFALAFDEMNNPVLSANYNDNPVSAHSAPVSLIEGEGLGFAVYNEGKTRGFTIYKTSDDYETGIDEEGYPFYHVTYLEGAEFRLQRRVGSRDIWRDYGGAFTSKLAYHENGPALDGYGNHIAAASFPGGLLFGEYRLIETVVPEGHTANSKVTVTLDDGTAGVLVHSFVLLEDMLAMARTTTYTLQNHAVVDTMDFAFTKVDLLQPDTALAGFAFALYFCPQQHAHDALPAEDSCWTHGEVRHAVSETDGGVRFADLETGTYLLQETGAPEPYRLPLGVWLLEVDAKAGQVTITAPDSAAVPAFMEMNIENGETALLLPNEKRLILPLTGSRIKPWLLAGGIAFIILGVCFIRINRRKG